MPTTTNMGMVLPTEDASSDLWDTLLNAALTDKLDAHDHTTGKGLRVPTAGLNINADLSFGGFAATALKAMDLSPVAAATVSALTTALFVSSADNELYWRTSGGVNVKVTAGSSLNSSLLGGFTGDYGAGAEEAEFTSATGIYDFRVAATERGFIDCSDIRLFEKTAGITNAVKLKSPAALAASYTVTFPTAVPASTSLVMMSSAGVLSTSLTPTLTTVTTTGAASVGTSLAVGTTLGVTGLVTATAGITANGPVTVATTALITGVITPTQLAANTNDWAPTGMSGASIIRASTDALRNLTGITGGAAGRTLILINVGAFNLVLKDDATSTAANRFLNPDASDFAITPQSSCFLWYDGTSSRWRVITKA